MPRSYAKPFIHIKWTLACKLLRRVKSEQAKIICGSLTHIRHVGELL